MEREQTLQGLRELVAFLAEHPTVPLPACLHMINAFVDTREELAVVARAASWQKGWDKEDWFVLRREFAGDVALEVNIERERVCRKVVTGTQILPAQPERTVETYEWACDEPAILGA